MNPIQDAVENAKETVTAPLPTPPDLTAIAQPRDLKARLEWGEPALTIIDVRDRETYNRKRITGAIPMPIATLVEQAKASLEKVRDIYVYGVDDAQTHQAAELLREAGFTSVAELQGGVEGWIAISGSINGIDSVPTR